MLYPERTIRFGHHRAQVHMRQESRWNRVLLGLLQHPVRPRIGRELPKLLLARVDERIRAFISASQGKRPSRSGQTSWNTGPP